MFRLAGKRKEKTVAVADVGSGSVAVGIARASLDGSTNILVSERAVLPMSERSPEAAAAATMSLLEETARRALEKRGGAAPGARRADSALVVIHAPWARSKTVRAFTQFSEETRVGREMINMLAREALETESEYERGNIFEASVIRVELNGYPTPNPAGKRARHVAVSALLSECDPRVRDGATEALSRVFAIPPPAFRSDARALLSIARESSALPKESLIVNMTYDATDVMVVRKGVIVEMAFVREGTGSVLRRIAGQTLPEETLALIRLLALDRCEQDACEALRESLARAEQDLAKSFGDAFGALSSARRLPNRLVLLAHEDLSPWLARFFGRIDFAQFTVTTRPFMPMPLALENIRKLVVFGGGAVPDVPLGIAAALVNIECKAA